MSSPASRQQGLSLLELMVAVAVLALAVVALLHLGSQSTRSAQHSQQQALALIVLQNLAASGELSPEWGNQGQVELAGRQWHWQRRPVQGALPGIQGWHWAVLADSGQQVAELTSWQAAP